jgi:hypothetical protein
MHAAHTFGLGRSRTQLVHQRIDLCEYTFGGAWGV